jgi:hypothetical protein
MIKNPHLFSAYLRMAAEAPTEKPILLLAENNANKRPLKVQKVPNRNKIMDPGSYFRAGNAGFTYRFPLVVNISPKPGDVVLLARRAAKELVKYLGKGTHEGQPTWIFQRAPEKNGEPGKTFSLYLADRSVTWKLYTQNKFTTFAPEGYRPVLKGDPVGTVGLFISTNNPGELFQGTYLGRDDMDYKLQIKFGGGMGQSYAIDADDKGVLWEFFIIPPPLGEYAADEGEAREALLALAEENGEDSVANALGEEGWGGEEAGAVAVPNIALPLPPAVNRLSKKRKAINPAEGNEANENKRARPENSKGGARSKKQRKIKKSRKGTRKGSRSKRT